MSYNSPSNPNEDDELRRNQQRQQAQQQQQQSQTAFGAQSSAPQVMQPRSPTIGTSARDANGVRVPGETKLVDGNAAAREREAREASRRQVLNNDPGWKTLQSAPKSWEGNTQKPPQNAAAPSQLVSTGGTVGMGGAQQRARSVFDPPDGSSTAQNYLHGAVDRSINQQVSKGAGILPMDALQKQRTDLIAKNAPPDPRSQSILTKYAQPPKFTATMSSASGPREVAYMPTVNQAMDARMPGYSSLPPSEKASALRDYRSGQTSGRVGRVVADANGGTRWEGVNTTPVGPRPPTPHDTHYAAGKSTVPPPAGVLPNTDATRPAQTFYDDGVGRRLLGKRSVFDPPLPTPGTGVYPSERLAKMEQGVPLRTPYMEMIHRVASPPTNEPQSVRESVRGLVRASHDNVARVQEQRRQQHQAIVQARDLEPPLNKLGRDLYRGVQSAMEPLAERIIDRSSEGSTVRKWALGDNPARAVNHLKEDEEKRKTAKR